MNKLTYFGRDRYGYNDKLGLRCVICGHLVKWHKSKGLKANGYCCVANCLCQNRREMLIAK